jgi:hypothetical protein
MSRQPSGRQRGGQPGNKNRLKHGLYSKQVSQEDSAELESMSLDRTEHELALARVRLKTCIEKQLTAAPEDWLSYERAITHYLRLIASLIQKNAESDGPGDAFMTVMEMIRQVNEEDHVK